MGTDQATRTYISIGLPQCLMHGGTVARVQPVSWIKWQEFDLRAYRQISRIVHDEPTFTSVCLDRHTDVPGFCKRATLEDIRKHGLVLAPGRYVGAAAAEDDGEPLDEKMKRLTATLREQQTEAAKLIAANLKELGYGG